MRSKLFVSELESKINEFQGVDGRYLKLQFVASPYQPNCVPRHWPEGGGGGNLRCHKSISFGFWPWTFLRGGHFSTRDRPQVFDAGLFPCQKLLRALSRLFGAPR